MCKVKIWLCVVMLLAVVGNTLGATDESKMEKEGKSMYKHRGEMTGKSSVLKSANELMGADVKNNMGENLGSVKELIINQSKDDVQYLVVSSEDMLHPVPWAAIKCGEANEPKDTAASERKEKGIVLNISKEQFHQAPTVESIDIAQLSSSSLKQQVDSFYSTQIEETKGMWERMKSGVKEKMPSGMKGETSESEAQANLFKCSDLIGMDIQNLNDEQIASINDVVIDTRKGNIAYGLVGFGGVLGVREKIAAVPWSAISIQPDRSTAKLDATKENLETATLTEGDISQLNQRQFAQQVHETFGVEPYWQVYGFEAPGQETGTPQREMKKEQKQQYKERKEKIEQSY